MMCPVARAQSMNQFQKKENGFLKEIKDISGFCMVLPVVISSQQGACNTLNVKEGIIEEALIETIGCSGMTHSAAMAAEILPGKDNS